MKRKIILLFILSLFIVGLGMVVSRVKSQRSVTANSFETLSERSKEFIESQKKMDDSIVSRSRLLDSSQTNQSQGEVKSECFTADIHLPMEYRKSTSNERGCMYQANIVLPASKIVITVTKQVGSKLAEDTGVTHRRNMTAEYTEQNVVFADYDDAYQFVAKDSVSTFLQKDDTRVTVIFFSIARYTPDYLIYMQSVVESLKVEI
ncbi:MAG: hypothetical protein M3Q81_00045 [bacterium]|nr:hypothetical protein [bacterium]